MKYLTYMILGLVAFATACTENLDPTPLDYTTTISGKISKTWKLRSIAFRKDGKDFLKFNVTCSTDDTYTFYRDTERKFEFKSGSVKCDPLEEKVTIVDTWSFMNANATLFFVMPLFSDNALPFTVVDIDKNDMVLEFYFNDDGSQSYQLKFDLKDEK